MQLDQCGKHNANSHDEDKSKYLKHDQIVAVTDAVTIAQQQSAAQLRRNMQRAQLTIRQLRGFNIDSSFGSLIQFADAK